MLQPSLSATPPAINLPPATKYLILVLLAIHLVRQVLPDDIDTALVVTFGFIPARYSGGAPLPWNAFAAPVTYMFLHGGWLHLGVNLASLAAFGTAVERPLNTKPSARSMLTVFFLSGIAGALSQYLAAPGSDGVLIGASGGISGLFAYAFLTMASETALTLRRAATLIAIMVVVLGVTGAAMGKGGMPGLDSPIAWIAHIGGFLAGAALYGLKYQRRTSDF